MSMTVEELAQHIGANRRGDADRLITGCAGLEEAGPEHVSFVANPRYIKHLSDSQAGAVVVSPEDARKVPDRTLLVADDPYFAFRQAVIALHGFRQHPAPGVSALAQVDADAVVGQACVIEPFTFIAAGTHIGNRCVIYPHCYIGPNVSVGDDCVLYPNVTIYDRCILGNRVTLHAGCVIGQDGFGYATHEGAHHKIPQIGNAVIEDDVELGANCAIDRATVGSTVIGEGTKSSDLITIGHGARIGRHNLLVAQIVVAGSATTGDYVVMGGQAGVGGHLRVGDGAQLAARTGVTRDIDGGKQYGQMPAVPWPQARRNMVAGTKLHKLVQDLKTLQKRVAELERGAGEELTS